MRLTNDTLGRVLHNALYQRMLTFCQEYTPEFPGDIVVQGWLSRLYNDDQNLHILVNLDNNYKITGHCVIDVQEAYGNKVIFVHQAAADRGNSVTMDEGMEYVNKLANEIGAICISAAVAKNSKVYEKKYGFTAVRTQVVKFFGDADEQ